MDGILRRREAVETKGEGGGSLLYELPSPKIYANNSYEDTGVVIGTADTYTICVKYDLTKVASYSSPTTIFACMWQLKNSGNTSTTAKFRHYIQNKYNWTDGYFAGDTRLVIVGTPANIIVYYVSDTNGTVSNVSRTAADYSVSETVKFGSLNGKAWTTFEVWNYAWTQEEATTFLTE